MKAGPIDPGLKKAAEGLEGFFVRQFLKAANLDLSGGSTGAGASTFQGMFQDALADEVVKNGGLGLQDVIAAQLASQGAGSSASLQGAGSSASLQGAGSSASLLGPGAPMSPAQLHIAPRTAQAVYGRSGGISSGFGARLDPLDGHREQHLGLDLPAPQGSPVHVPFDGVVKRAEAAGGYGNLVIVEHANGVETRYAHLSRIDVVPGQTVTPDDAVGAVGTTGHSTGPHLHFELRRDGQAVDPRKFIDPIKVLR